MARGEQWPWIACWLLLLAVFVVAWRAVDVLEWLVPVAAPLAAMAATLTLRAIFTDRDR